MFFFHSGTLGYITHFLFQNCLKSQHRIVFDEERINMRRKSIKMSPLTHGVRSCNIMKIEGQITRKNLCQIFKENFKNLRSNLKNP